MLASDSRPVEPLEEVEREPDAGRAPTTVGPSARSLVMRAARLVLRRMHITVVVAALGFGLGWLGNVWIMGQKYDGFRVPAGSPATGDGNVVRGSLFWFLASMLLSTVVAYRLTLGRERFWAEVRDLPVMARHALSKDGDQTALHLLVGFAGALVAVVVVGPSISAVLVGVVAVGLARVARPLVTGACQVVWRAVASKVAPARVKPPSAVAFVVGTLGSIGAFALGTLLPGQQLELVIALVAAIAAIVLARSRRPIPPSPTALLLVVLGGAVLCAFAMASPAYADDGGFSECGNPGVWGYITNCGGSGNVLALAMTGGIATGIGAVVGAAAGAAAAEETPGSPPVDDPGAGGPGGPEDDEEDEEEKERRRKALFEAEATWFTDEERQKRLVGYFGDWMAANPEGFDADAFTAFANKQEESAFYQVNFGIWRLSNPDAPATEFEGSGSWYDQAKAGKRTGNIEDATMETADAISLLMGAPGLLKLGVSATKGVVSLADDALREASVRWAKSKADRAVVKDAWKIVDEWDAKWMKMTNSKTKAPIGAITNMILKEGGPEMLETWVKSMPEKQLKNFYHAFLYSALDDVAKGTKASSVIVKAIGDKGLPMKWDKELVNAVARGKEIPAWAKGISEADTRRFAEMWLKNNTVMITGKVPTVDQLVTRWMGA